MPVSTGGRVPLPAPRRLCLMCRRPLGVGERKVHWGACARKRKTELQRRRRQRGASSPRVNVDALTAGLRYGRERDEGA